MDRYVCKFRVPIVKGKAKSPNDQYFYGHYRATSLQLPRRRPMMSWRKLEELHNASSISITTNLSKDTKKLALQAVLLEKTNGMDHQIGIKI